MIGWSTAGSGNKWFWLLSFCRHHWPGRLDCCWSLQRNKWASMAVNGQTERVSVSLRVLTFRGGNRYEGKPRRFSYSARFVRSKGAKVCRPLVFLLFLSKPSFKNRLLSSACCTLTVPCTLPEPPHGLKVMLHVATHDVNHLRS